MKWGGVVGLEPHTFERLLTPSSGCVGGEGCGEREVRATVGP